MSIRIEEETPEDSEPIFGTRKKPVLKKKKIVFDNENDDNTEVKVLKFEAFGLEI
jgi:hypothetical protein